MIFRNKNGSGQPFAAAYVNPARRDLIKQLAAMGAIGAGGLHASLLHAADGKASAVALTGAATWKKDAVYEDLRKALLWTANTPARYPDVIVQAKSESEIRNALQFAASNRLRVVCRSSGHNTSGAVLRNGGMLLDISSLKEVSVDAARLTASVQPAVLMYYFYQQLAAQGLIFPIAECHTVALGGFLLGGGHSPLGFAWGDGPACYSVIGADIILASGEKVTVNKDEHADLYWAIRGVGPGFFGVITRYHLQLYPHPETILKSTYTYPVESLPRVISILDDLLAGKDKRVQTSISLDEDPKSPGSTIANLDITAITARSANSEAEAGSLLARYARSELSRLAAASNENQKIQFPELMVTPDRSQRVNLGNIWTDDPKALLALVRHFRNKPPKSSLMLALGHGLRTAPHRSDACYSPAGKHYLSYFIFWRGLENDAANNRWCEEFSKILRPYTTGHYINEIDNEPRPSKFRNSFSKENWQRLAAVRKKYDPGNRFYSYVGYD